MRRRDDMTFPPEEYERRISELRERMKQRLLDAVIISDPENIMYLTDYQTTGYSFFQAIVVPQDGDCWMVTRKLEESNVHARTWVELTRPFKDTGDAIQTLVDSLAEFGLAKGTVGYERNSYFLPAYQQDRIRGLFTQGRMIDCFGIVEEGRLCKSKHELEAMKKAAHAAEAGMKAGIEAVQVGVSENEIGAEISAAMFRAGGEPPAVMPYVTSGPRTMIGHATWEGRKVEAGDHVFLEVGGCFRRYHAALMRTIVIGEMSSELENAEYKMMQALEQLHKEIHPGLTVSDADKIARDIIASGSHGGELITRSGYSIGIAFPPSWDEGYILSLMQGDPTPFKVGMTFHLIPWIWGAGGKQTVGISDTIHVTETGCESFFSLGREFTRKEAPVKSASKKSGGGAKTPSNGHAVSAS